VNTIRKLKRRPRPNKRAVESNKEKNIDRMANNWAPRAFVFSYSPAVYVVEETEY
jgi:hypothetical protein